MNKRWGYIGGAGTAEFLPDWPIRSLGTRRLRHVGRRAPSDGYRLIPGLVEEGAQRSAVAHVHVRGDCARGGCAGRNRHSVAVDPDGVHSRRRCTSGVLLHHRLHGTEHLLGSVLTTIGQGPQEIETSTWTCARRGLAHPVRKSKCRSSWFLGARGGQRTSQFSTGSKVPSVPRVGTPRP